MAFTYRLVFASTLITPPDQALILDIESTLDTDEATIHEAVLDAFRRWLHESETGVRLAEDVGEFPTLASIFDSISWEEVRTVMPFLESEGITEFEYELVNTVWDLDEQL